MMKDKLSVLISICLLTSSIALAQPQSTFRDKIGQMLVIGFDGKQIDAQSQLTQVIEKNNIGGVILFDYNSRTKNYDKNIESPAQVMRLTKDLQYYSAQGHLNYNRPNLPLLISVDYEGGKVNRLNEKYGFPPTRSAAYIGKRGLDEAGFMAQEMAETLKVLGFNLNFAPVVDVNVNPDNPVIGKKDRSFSQDPTEVAKYASVYTEQFIHQKIQCAYKHFPGHGSSSEDSHLGFVDVTKTWQPYELAPYQQLFDSNEACGMVMTAHIVNRQLDESGLPATLSHKILTDLLRHQLHFKGVIITDDMQMKAISDHYGLENALVRAINAGADMLIFGNNLTVEPQNPEQLIDIIEAKVLSGEINPDRIIDAYQHIVSLKKSME